MSRPLDFIRTQALLGWGPRHVIDVSPGEIAVAEGVLQEARRQVQEAARLGDEIAENLERRCHELWCIEDSGLSGTFRRLIAISVLAVPLLERYNDQGSGAWPLLVAAHRAAEERWVGGTYDLSNCLGCLNHLLITKHELEGALGTWVWLNLGAGDQSHHFRWVLSTRRFEPGLGSAILAQARRGVGLNPAGASAPPVTREEARALAKRYAAENPELGATAGVSSVVGWDQISWRPPLVYGKDEAFWKRHWIVYMDQPQKPGMIMHRPSVIIAVDRFTGEIGYAGSANDEG